MIQTVWSGGVTRDGVTPLTPGASPALPRLLHVWLADGRALDDDARALPLGLACLFFLSSSRLLSWASCFSLSLSATFSNLLCSSFLLWTIVNISSNVEN